MLARLQNSFTVRHSSKTETAVNSVTVWEQSIIDDSN